MQYRIQLMPLNAVITTHTRNLVSKKGVDKHIEYNHLLFSDKLLTIEGLK